MLKIKKLKKKVKYGHNALVRFDYDKNLHKYFIIVNKYLN